MSRAYLVEMRTQRNESQQDVATALGITRQYYSLIEDGSRQKRMDIALAAMLAEHFGVPLNEIVNAEQKANIVNDPH